jgi:Mrp family chromosome partitioning ATPase
MREVDQALARVYAQRVTRERAGAVPAPHVTPRAPEPATEGADPGTYQFVERTQIRPFDRPGLEWPATVRALERQFGDRFDRMADLLIQAREQRRLKVFLFTSCHRAEGRTTLVLTLARALARRPGRTLLVDGDLTGPMLARQLGMRPETGLDDVVEDGVALSEALLESAEDHLTVLPLRAPVARPREFLASPAWSCAMARLRREFDMILVDGSPMFAGLNAAVLHRSVDAAVLVHNRSLTGERALLRAREVLDAGGVPLLGLAETFV